MNKYFLLAISLFSTQINAGSLYFDVTSSNDAINVPITLCLEAKREAYCQLYVAKGLDLSLKLNPKLPDYLGFPNAGIKVNVPGYKVSGCNPYGNEYCIFSVSTHAVTHIQLLK